MLDAMQSKNGLFETTSFVVYGVDCHDPDQPNWYLGRIQSKSLSFQNLKSKSWLPKWGTSDQDYGCPQYELEYELFQPVSF